MFKLISNILGMWIVITAILTLVRFVGPECYLCRIKGEGSSTRTTCLGLVQFKGDDLLSVYRLRLATIREK